MQKRVDALYELRCTTLLGSADLHVNYWGGGGTYFVATLCIATSVHFSMYVHYDTHLAEIKSLLL